MGAAERVANVLGGSTVLRSRVRSWQDLDKVGVCKSLDELKKVSGLDYKKIEARKEFIVCFEAPPPPKDPK